MKQFDCVIVGGGPAGLTAALYLARFRRNVVVVDSGTSRARLIGRSHNCPGFVHGVSGPDYLASLHDQAAKYRVELRSETVETIGRDADRDRGFRLRTNQGELGATQILLATGIRDRHPPIADHDEVVRQALLRYCPVCDGYEASGRSICVMGPVEQASAKVRFLRTYSSSIVLAATDRDPLPEEVEEMASLKVKIRRAGPEPLEKEGAALLVPFGDGRRERFDAVYPAMGAEPASAIIAALGVRTNEQGLVLIDDKNRTSVAGIYAAGDTVSDLHQIAVAIGHAAIASTAIHNALASNYV